MSWQELITTKILKGEEKKRYDENYDRIFKNRKPTGVRREEQHNGFKVRINYPQGEEQLKILDSKRTSNTKVAGGMF
jgi:hypothetical protein